MLDILEELLKLSYFGIFLILVVINTILIFMPPSWVVLSSFHVAEPKLSILALTIIGATGSLLGRIILIQISTNFRIFVRKEKISSLDNLHVFSEKKDMVIFWHHFFIHYHHSHPISCLSHME